MDKMYEQFIKRAEKFNKEQINQKSISGLVAKEFILFENLSDEERENLIENLPIWQPDIEYKPGNVVRYEDTSYEVIQEHTSQEGWAPPAVTALFKIYWKSETDNGEELVHEWVQPQGGHDAYSTGDKVTHNGNIWESTLDGNVWEPGTYGWDRIK